MNLISSIFEAIGLLQIAPVARAPQNVPPYAGMDTSGYPGAAVMNQALASSNLVWTGMYFDSPTLVTGENPRPPFTRPDGTPSVQRAQNGQPLLDANGNAVPKRIFYGHWGGAQSWAGAWSDLHPAWGLLPIYWGQQDPNNTDGPFDLRTVIAVANAAEAATTATNAGIPVGAVIYLDWEIGGIPSAAGVAYCRAWFQRLAEGGYRPGVYCHPPASRSFRQEWPQLFVWNVNLAAFGGLTVVGGRLMLATPNLNDKRGEAPDLDSVARQWRFGLAQPPHSPIAGFPGIDADASTIGDPSFPERRVQPSLVRGGALTGAIVDASTLVLFAIRRGALVAGTWTTANWSSIVPVALADHVLAYNPFSVNAAIQRGTSGDVAIIARSAAVGAADDAWQLHAYRRRGATWTFDENISGATQIEPLLGVRLVSRKPNTVEAFFITNDGTNRVFVVSCIDAATQADGQTWTVPVEVNAPAGGMQPSLVGGIGAASREVGTTDVFVVARAAAAQSCQLFWNSSSILGTWPQFSVPGDPAVVLHPFSNVAAISRGPKLVDVFAIAKKDITDAWTLYRWWWNQAESWGAAPNFHTQPIVGTLVSPHPASKVAAVSRSSQFIDVFIVGATDGLLYNAFWDSSTNKWSDFRPVGFNAVKVGSVDGAFSRAATSVDVVVTGRDGNVYVSSWNTLLAGYSDLAQIAPLNLA